MAIKKMRWLHLRGPNVWTAAVFMVVAAALVVYGLADILQPIWPPMACAKEECKEGREWISASFALMVLLGGLYQYRRSQLWKRAQFVAKEMKTFRAEPLVVNAMTMIDWTSRRLDLLNTGSKDPKDWVAVTRRLQNRALWPHKLLHGDHGYHALEKSAPTDSESLETQGNYEEKDSGLAGYSREHVVIRDAYDSFLDGLERFANHLHNGLVTIADLRPYLGYWIDDIANQSDNQAENEWTFWLLSYLHFYGYTGVNQLFLEFRHDVSIDSEAFGFFMSQVEDQKLARRVRSLICRAQNATDHVPK